MCYLFLFIWTSVYVVHKYFDIGTGQSNTRNIVPKNTISTKFIAYPKKPKTSIFWFQITTLLHDSNGVTVITKKF